MEERETEDLEVAGSNPALGILFIFAKYALFAFKILVHLIQGQKLKIIPQKIQNKYSEKMNRVLKEYVPNVEYMPLNAAAKDYKLHLERKLQIYDVAALCSLR